MIPNLEEGTDLKSLVLLCPGCDNDYLHHEKVEIFDRSADEERGVHVTVGVEATDGSITRASTVGVDADMRNNPSSRRHGIRIHFSCELCDALPVLSLWQHKGTTFIAFEEPK